MDQLAIVFQTLWQIVLNLGDLIAQLLSLAIYWSLLIAWVAWWLLAVNWPKAWRILARGAWVPAVLLMVVSALVWSRIAPGELQLGLATIPNFWMHLVVISILVAVTLFCGWLQGVFHWAPPDVNLDPGVPTEGADTAHP